MKRTLSTAFFSVALRVNTAATALALPVALVALAAGATGCSTTLAQPFEANKGQPITVYRLQNYEAQPAAAAGGAAALPAGVPPQIQQWLSAGAALLPPGLLPPGLLPGGTPAAPATTDAPRFGGFRILGSASLTDAKAHDEALSIFGHDSNFETPRQSCMFAEFGFRIGYAPAPGTTTPVGAGAPLDLLVSLSCDQVQLVGAAWPYGAKNGLSADTTKRIVALVQKAFGG